LQHLLLDNCRTMPAKVFFYYSAMNAGKSSTLLQASYNYNERGLRTLLFIPKLIGNDFIASRIGLKASAYPFEPEFDFVAYAQKAIEDSPPRDDKKHDIGCILIDEAQFCTQAQVIQLTRVADEMQIPVLCYGLRSDFLGEPFEGSKYLMCYADVLTEIKTICTCGRKATMNQRIRADGTPLAAGEQIEVGGNERYVGRCRRHFYEGLEQARKQLPQDSKATQSDEPAAKLRKLAESTPEKKEPEAAARVTDASPSSA